MLFCPIVSYYIVYCGMLCNLLKGGHFSSISFFLTTVLVVGDVRWIEMFGDCFGGLCV